MPSPALTEIEKAVKTREIALEKLQQGLDLIMEAIDIAPRYTFETMLRNDVHWFSGDKDRYKVRAEKALDRKLWKDLLEKSKLGVVLNASQREKIEREIHDNPVPLTREVAVSTFLKLFEQREDAFREGIVDVFKRLSGNFRSHSPFRVEKRSILTGAVRDGYVRHDFSGKLFTDAWKFIYLLKGIDPTAIDIRNHPENIINDEKTGKSEFCFDGFRVKIFQNGNLHLIIEDQEVLNKINQIIAQYYEHQLPKAS